MQTGWGRVYPRTNMYVQSSFGCKIISPKVLSLSLTFPRHGSVHDVLGAFLARFYTLAKERSHMVSTV
ncbi:hypothetical protein OBBRIDRAFT_139356 [Obba rivulosa]|uniref:Uncharacterized protein n=1 Tax=Obba rivulosa TaxID=1052685 RepID=A0A8E2ATD8_9APHY|nr:hypothetical protein OBBRIDRAFT_139356 [Obba rivulosa]